jgi:hypothetical protein
MKPVDSFFLGLREAFRPDDNAGGSLLIVLVLTLAAALLWLVRRRQRRVRTRVEDLRRFIAAHHLTLDDVEMLEALATIAGERPLEVGTRLDVFERATAAALQDQRPTLTVRDNDVYARTRRLRQAFGFADLPSHLPLLTTRELAVGATIEIAGAPATVAEINEAFWSVSTRSNARTGAGAIFEAAVVRAHDARYLLTCRVLDARLVEGIQRLTLAHDESPAREQMREFVRVAGHGGVWFRPAAKPGVPVVEASGTLVDVSLGGLAARTSATLAAPIVGTVAFMFADKRYQGIEATVLDCRRVGGEAGSASDAGPFLLRLRFRKFPAGEEQRLAAAISLHTARPTLPESA